MDNFFLINKTTISNQEKVHLLRGKYKLQTWNLLPFYMQCWHACHISYSQNLGQLKANSQSHRPFRPSCNTFYEEVNINHTLLCVPQAYNKLHLNKGFWLFWGSSKVIFVKISQNLIKSAINICLKVIFVKISQNLIKSPLNNRFQSTAYGMYIHVCIGQVTVLRIY